MTDRAHTLRGIHARTISVGHRVFTSVSIGHVQIELLCRYYIAEINGSFSQRVRFAIVRFQGFRFDAVSTLGFDVMEDCA